MDPWTADKVAKSKAAHGVGIIEIAAEGGSWRVVPGVAVRPAHHRRHADRARRPGGGARVDEDRRRSRGADRARHVQQLLVRQDAVGDVPDLRGERHAVFRAGLRRAHAPAAALRRRAQQGCVGFAGKIRSALRRRPLSQRAQPPRLGRRDRSDGPEVAAREANRAGADVARRRDGDAGARRPRGRLHGRRRLPHQVRAHLQVRQPAGVRARRAAPPPTATCSTTGRCTSRASTRAAPASGCRCAPAKACWTPRTGFRRRPRSSSTRARRRTWSGASFMDRPEWIAVHPQTKQVYCSLTNNSLRGKGKPPGGDAPLGADAANPRAPNAMGHIIRWREQDGDAAATKFLVGHFPARRRPGVARSAEARQRRRRRRVCAARRHRVR